MVSSFLSLSLSISECLLLIHCLSQSLVQFRYNLDGILADKPHGKPSIFSSIIVCFRCRGTFWGGKISPFSFMMKPRSSCSVSEAIVGMIRSDCFGYTKLYTTMQGTYTGLYSLKTAGLYIGKSTWIYALECK